MDNRECEDTSRPAMSEIKLDDVGPGLSVNRFSSGLSNHNLTGTKTRFQPVRIKAMLNLSDSDDDDTEPRDSDDNNSDAESLQALPDDGEADVSGEESKIDEGIERISVREEEEAIKREDIEPEIVLAPSSRKTTTLVPYDFDAVDKPSLFTPRALHFSSHTERRENSDGQNSFKYLEVGQNCPKNESRVLETPLKRSQDSFKNVEVKSEIETPMKFGHNCPKSMLKVLETPLKRSHGDYPQNVVETPGVIFSHWSRNNYLQTPTAYNPMLTSTKTEEAGAHFQDPRIFNSENRLVQRKPLGEATHLNQPEHHSLVRRTLQLPYVKENASTEGKCEVKENLANTARRSPIERDVSLSRTEPKAKNNERPAVAGSENVNSKSSNPANVQFSVSAKPKDKKYGQLISVKGSDYVVLGKLGQGMSGNVLRVQEVKTGELRAIKCVDLSQIDKETAQGCLEEVALLERLRAPCIIHMFTYEIKAHWLYVVLEMGDTDLSKLLKSMPRDKKLPLTMILYYWTEMLTAVQHIHDNDVIHSDLKPANFLLVRGRLKLIDFGIASTLNSEMTSVVKNTSLGTLHYISPEAIEDVGGNGDSPSGNNKYKLNFQSDVWSLGCILYGLVYGQTPFEHIRADWAKVAAITNPKQKISFPPTQAIGRRGYSSPPPFLVDVMRRCLQHDKKARPTVRQLLEIPYVGCNCPPASSLPSISPAILLKIKESLGESEWRQLLDTLERRRPL